MKNSTIVSVISHHQTNAINHLSTKKTYDHQKISSISSLEMQTSNNIRKLIEQSTNITTSIKSSMKFHSTTKITIQNTTMSNTFQFLPFPPTTIILPWSTHPLSSHSIRRNFNNSFHRRKKSKS